MRFGAAASRRVSSGPRHALATSGLGRQVPYRHCVPMWKLVSPGREYGGSARSGWPVGLSLRTTQGR